MNAKLVETYMQVVLDFDKASAKLKDYEEYNDETDDVKLKADI